MGSAMSYRCLACGTDFRIFSGGGFFFDRLQCDACGSSRSVSHEEMGDIHLAFVKGLPGPYAVSRRNLDQHIKETFQGPALDRDAYHAAVEASLEPCICGGRFRYDAPARCPGCRSTQEQWDADDRMPVMLYD